MVLRAVKYLLQMQASMQAGQDAVKNDICD